MKYSVQQILFRADGNSKIGLGHLYRLFAIFEMLKEEYDCIFVTKVNSTINVIPKDYLVELMPLDLKLENEAQWLKNNFQNNAIVIADGYQFKSDYQKSIKGQEFKLVYIDDLQEYHMYADLVINHTPGILAENYSSEPYTQFALGADYAILRPLFLEAAKEKRKIEKIKTAFICFGGADPSDITLKTTREILEIDLFKNINIVIGGAYKHTVIFSIHKENTNINIHQNLSEYRMVELIQKSDVAYTSASVISIEASAVNIGLYVKKLVDNQEFVYNGLIQSGAAKDIKDFDFEDIEQTVNQMIFKQRQLIDHKSKTRLIDKIHML